MTGGHWCLVTSDREVISDGSHSQLRHQYMYFYLEMVHFHGTDCAGQVVIIMGYRGTKYEPVQQYGHYDVSFGFDSQFCVLSTALYSHRHSTVLTCEQSSLHCEVYTDLGGPTIITIHA